jgi:Tfp pilus assembly protein PilV
MRGETGLSLVELMVALVLLAVALFGLAVAFPPARYAVEQGSQISVAAGLARQVLEEMRNRRYNQGVDELTAANYPPEAYGAIPGHGSFRRSVTIEDNVPEATCVPPSTPPNTPCTKRVTVSVFFRDATGAEQAVDVRTIFVR